MNRAGWDDQQTEWVCLFLEGSLGHPLRRSSTEVMWGDRLLRGSSDDLLPVAVLLEWGCVGWRGGDHSMRAGKSAIRSRRLLARRGGRRDWNVRLCVHTVWVGEWEKLVESRGEGGMAGRETCLIYGVPFQFLKPAHFTLTQVIRGGVGEALL